MYMCVCVLKIIYKKEYIFKGIYILKLTYVKRNIYIYIDTPDILLIVPLFPISSPLSSFVLESLTPSKMLTDY